MRTCTGGAQPPVARPVPHCATPLSSLHTYVHTPPPMQSPPYSLQIFLPLYTPSHSHTYHSEESDSKTPHSVMRHTHQPQHPTDHPQNCQHAVRYGQYKYGMDLCVCVCVHKHSIPCHEMSYRTALVCPLLFSGSLLNVTHTSTQQFQNVY